MTTKFLSTIALILLLVTLGMILMLYVVPTFLPYPVDDSQIITPTEPVSQTEPPTQPQIQTEPPTQPPTQPPAEEFVLSFAGDCCLANLKGWSEDRYFIGTIGDNYAYPFASVQEYFAADDCTFINLECVFTDSTRAVNKDFVFKGPTTYTRILTEGSVEFANIANNHTQDYGQTGYEDTAAALDEAGISYAHARETRIFTTPSGLTIGVYADTYPKDTDGLKEKIEAMRAEGAELIIAVLHWGKEYYYVPNEKQIELGHAAIDAGADIVYGTHPHVLQPIEEYKGKYIYYSLANFSFGGNTNPTDKDTAIIQQKIIRESDGTIILGDLTIIPCSVSSRSDRNDFQPTPLEPGSEAYNRVLSKLDGSYDKKKISVNYRPELG